jgi:redox-sensitive bicupin YhaK (pirin superfamily)
MAQSDTANPPRRIIRHDQRVRRSEGWGEALHTFGSDSPGFSQVKDVVEAIITPLTGSDFRDHEGLELLTLMVAGRLESLDTREGHHRVSAGEVLRVSTSAGLTHCEFNPSPIETARCIQLWLHASRPGSQLSAERLKLSLAPSCWTLIASPTGHDGSLLLQSDSEVLIGQLATSERLGYDLGQGRHASLQVLRGSVTFDEVVLSGGDSAHFSGPSKFELVASEPAEVLLIEMD